MFFAGKIRFSVAVHAQRLRISENTVSRLSKLTAGILWNTTALELERFKESLTHHSTKERTFGQPFETVPRGIDNLLIHNSVKELIMISD